MINALKGKIVSVSEQDLILDVNGVEYILLISQRSAEQFLNMDKNEEVRVLTHFIVRQDMFILCGFSSSAERDAFNQLQTVQGIGLKQALKILSCISVNELIKALDEKDVTALSRIPGLGAKTAQKLILQLRNTLVYNETTTKPSKNVESKYKDLIDSLSTMGFDKKTINTELDKLLKTEQNLIFSLNSSEAEKYIFTALLRKLS